MNNKNLRKPSLFAETKGAGQKKTGVLAGIETGVENNTSSTSKILLLIAVIPIIVWLAYIAISKVTITNSNTDILSATKGVLQHADSAPIVQAQNELIAEQTIQNEGSAKIIDEPLPTEIKSNDEDMVSTAFDALETNPQESNETVTAKPKPKQAQAKRKKTNTNKQTEDKTEANTGDIAVLQALLEYKKVPTKPQTETRASEPESIDQQTVAINDEPKKEQAEPKQYLALAEPTSSGPATTPQQALLSNGLNNQELAATAGADKDPTMLSGTKALIEKCDEMDELDAAICKWDVCDQYGGDESMCSKAFTKKKEKPRFKFLKYLGLD